MKKPILLFTLACILAPPLLEGCHTSHKTTAYKSSRQPKFIDNVYIAPHNKNSATVDAIDPTKPPAKTKTKQNTNGTAITTASVPLPNPATKTNTPPTIVYKDLPNRIKKKYADILGVRPKEITNYPLYDFIDRWYGTTYRLGGCDISGVDCSGFAQKLYSEVYGIDLVRTAVEQFSNCKRIKHSRDAEEGDLVFFHVHSRHITHVGIYLANNFFVHASTSNGVMISNLDEDYWHKYYAGCGRIPHED